MQFDFENNKKLMVKIEMEIKREKEMETQKREIDEGLTPTKDGGTCLRRLSMFRKEVH